MKEYDVYGIGSALMDFLVEVDNEFLKNLSLEKGNMQLIDEKRSEEIFNKIKERKMKIVPGGSSANTLAGIALLGGNVVFCGKVGEDDHGDMYEKRMIEIKVKSNISKSNMITGHAITFITPDSERTFATHLGAATKLRKEDIFEEDIKKSKILHIEGYQLEDPDLKEASVKAMDIAKENKTKISIDLADPGLIERNREELREIVNRYADIVFVNENEAKMFTGKDEEGALDEISKMAEIAIVKIGEKGSMIKKGEERFDIPIYKVDAVDTTGAGDMYAAGFLYGLCKDYQLDRCGKIGAYVASKVVSQIGARLDNINMEEIDSL